MKWSVLKISISDDTTGDTTPDFDVSEDGMPEFGLRGENFPSKGGLSDLLLLLLLLLDALWKYQF